MSNNENNPYDNFFKKSGADEVAEASEELAKNDRGQPELKIEKSYSLKDNKNMIAVIGVVIFTLIIVAILIVKLTSRINSDDLTKDVVFDESLAKVQFEDITKIQGQMNAEQSKKEAAAKLARERLQREAKEKAEREAAEKARQELAAGNGATNPPPVTENKLGRFGGSNETPARMAEARTKKPKDLTPEEAAMLRKSSGGVLGYEPARPESSAASNDLDRPSTLGNMLITERHKNGTAFLRASREYLLMRGTNIPCTLLPRVVTNYVSQPTCMVNEDVYSPEGIVLVERGSKVIGEQRTAMKAGVSKVFIAWADIETPEGVSIKIDSMGADQLGGSGVDAWIDHHYMQRFGGAILLSFIDDLAEIASSKITKAEYNFEQSTDNASSMAQIVLENTINIEPTGYIMPASQINIIVARDVDFTHIYKVR